MATNPTPSERRRYPRLALGKATKLRPNEWSIIEVEVVDFSPHGFRTKCDAILRVGHYVSLDVPGTGIVNARVAWCRNGELGATFVNPIDEAHCGWFKEATAAASDAESAEVVTVAQLAERLARHGQL